MLKIAAILLLAAPLIASAQGGFFSERSLVEVDYNGKFIFTRIRYGSSPNVWGFRSSSWNHDYPRADRHLPVILDDLTTIPAHLDGSNVFDLDDPEIFRNPVIYMSEPGYWGVTDSEAANLRTYLLKGGFIIFDDFENEQWDNLETQMQHVLPEHRFIEIDITHPIFHSFFEMKEIYFQHPLVPVIPKYLAIFENDDPSRRMMALANYNNDLAEFWEWSATGMFPVDTTSEAYKLGVNYIVYALTH